MVEWVPNASPLKVESGIEVLLDPQAKKIAIANPKVAPYGGAGRSGAKKLGVFEQVEGRLVFGDNVAQTAQFVESGGRCRHHRLVAGSLSSHAGQWALLGNSRRRSSAAGARGVILKRCEHVEAARQFCDFLRGEQGRAIFHRYGFVLPEE